jgi:L-fuculose-phosphate aldolase
MPRKEKPTKKLLVLPQGTSSSRRSGQQLSEAAVREEICRVGRWMWERGYVCGREGNISVRLASGRMLCTPTEVSKGAMEPADMAVLDGEGRQIAGDTPVTTEFRLHLHIYRACPAVAAVVHAHSPCATAFAVARKTPPSGVLPEVEMLLGPIALAEYCTPGSDAVAEGAAARIKAGARAVLLANHGAVAAASTLMRAWWRMETLERYCQVVLLAGHLGGPRPLSAGELNELLAMKRRMGLVDPRLSHGHESGRQRKNG